MKKINHISISFAVSLWVYFYLFSFNIFDTFIMAILTAGLAWLPDLDVRILNNLRDFTKKTFYLFYPIYFICKYIFKHRTWSHSIWLVGVFGFLSYFFWSVDFYFARVFLILAMAIGLHIVEDSFTVSGVRWFWPIGFKFRLGNFNTSSEIHFIILEFFAYLIFFGFLYFVWNLKFVI